MIRLLIPASVCKTAKRLALITVTAVTFGFGSFLASSRAQTPDDVLTTSTALVQLNVGVVDKRGQVVTNLSANDFSVFED
ncbi:MAG TPA: hypothetical protein VFU37_00085, partial [Pyrinomonadaceae bacterium]|nr:hypothetical protein [Pyrinomonadaceae bacterium]